MPTFDVGGSFGVADSKRLSSICQSLSTSVEFGGNKIEAIFHWNVCFKPLRRRVCASAIDRQGASQPAQPPLARSLAARSPLIRLVSLRAPTRVDQARREDANDRALLVDRRNSSCVLSFLLFDWPPPPRSEARARVSRSPSLHFIVSIVGARA